MSNELFKFLLVGVAVLAIVVSVISVINRADPVLAAPKGISQVKLFASLEAPDVESIINDWLAAQSGILIDSINVDAPGNYNIGIGFHTGGTGNASTRFKLFQLEWGEVSDTEAAVNAFLNSLSASQTVRAIDVVVGTSRNVAVFILYD